MNVFDVIKENLTTRQIIANEGFYISRNGMMKCPFHDDHHPSLNVKERFKCFACGEYGDGINFVAKLYGLSLLNAAKKMLISELALVEDRDAMDIEKQITTLLNEELTIEES